jgi:hypothetical protein
VASAVQGTAVLAVTSIAEEWSLSGESLLPGDQLRFTRTASTDAVCADAAAAMPLTTAGDTFVELYYTATQTAAAATGAVTAVTGRFTFAETDGGATAYACVKFGSELWKAYPLTAVSVAQFTGPVSVSAGSVAVAVAEYPKKWQFPAYFGAVGDSAFWTAADVSDDVVNDDCDPLTALPLALVGSGTGIVQVRKHTL